MIKDFEDLHNTIHIYAYEILYEIRASFKLFIQTDQMPVSPKCLRHAHN